MGRSQRPSISWNNRRCLLFSVRSKFYSWFPLYTPRSTPIPVLLIGLIAGGVGGGGAGGGKAADHAACTLLLLRYWSGWKWRHPHAILTGFYSLTKQFSSVIWVPRWMVRLSWTMKAGSIYTASSLGQPRLRNEDMAALFYRSPKRSPRRSVQLAEATNLL